MADKHPDTLRQLIRLCQQGLSDAQVAEEIGLTRSQVWYLRTREGLPPSLPSGGAGRRQRARGRLSTTTLAVPRSDVRP